MAGYVDYSISVDPDQLVRQAVAQLRAATGATLNETHPLVALLEAVAYRNAETRVMTADVGEAIYRTHGRKVYGVTPIDDEPATAETTWTAVDDAGYTIPAGTVVVYATAGDRKIAFATVEETVIPPGSTQATGVEIEAVVPGSHANGLSAGTVTPNDGQLSWVSSVVTTTETSGGVDAETDAEYVARLTAEIRAASTGGLVLPADYETAARRVAGVHRALAIDGYEPVGPSTGNERTVTVAVVDEGGAAVSTAIKDEVEAELEARRETTFVVHVVDPDFTAVTVEFAAVAESGADEVTLEAEAIAALEAYLDPGIWAGGDESPPAWRDRPVRYFDLVHLIEDIDGIDYLVSLTVNAGTADVTLSGVAPLPDPTVTGTVSTA